MLAEGSAEAMGYVLLPTSRHPGAELLLRPNKAQWWVVGLGATRQREAPGSGRPEADTGPEPISHNPLSLVPSLSEPS